MPRTGERKGQRMWAVAAALAGMAACAEPAPEPTADARCAEAAAAAAAPSQTTAPEILAVCDETNLTVVFAAFQDDEPLALAPGGVAVSLAKLLPADESHPRSRWQSYLNRLEAPGSSGQWPAGAPQVQATTESDGELTAHREGIYSYTFAADLRRVSDPLEVPWNPALLHRLALEFRGEVEDPALGNPTYDWVPAETEPPVDSRKIVADGNCLECHGNMSVHGGPRTAVDACVLCHNPGSTDANSGNSVDFAVMTHRIHAGDQLPSVAEGGEEYALWGFRDSKHDYSHVAYPQDLRNCAKCHDPGEPERTPDAGLTQTNLSIEVCQSCHDNIRFDVGYDEFRSGDYPAWQTTHTAGPRAEGSCATCHGSDTEHSVANAHMTLFATEHNPQIPAGAVDVSYELLDVGLHAGTQPTARFRILVDGQPLDVRNPPATIRLGFFPQLRPVYAAAEGSVTRPGDWNNLANGHIVGQPAGTSIGFAAAGMAESADGSFSTPPGMLDSVPAGAAMVAVVLDGALEADISGNGDYERFAGDMQIRGVGLSDTPRRRIVDGTKCAACHERLEIHGGHRVNNVDGCVVCHNPNSTDIAVRPATVTGGTPAAQFTNFAAVGVDGRHEVSVDMRSMIHAIHMGEGLANGYVIYGHNRSIHDYGRVRYPNAINNCETCHLPGTYGLPLSAGALATTQRSAEAATVVADLAPADDDLNASPAGAACIGCHDSTAAVAHSEAGMVDWSPRIHGTEADSCATCHGPGEAYDVRQAHGLNAGTAE